VHRYATLVVERPRPELLVAKLNRPSRLNALTWEMFDELWDLQRVVDSDPGVRVLVLTGAGRAFCAGLDLDLAGTLPKMPLIDMLREQKKWADIICGFRLLSKPVIAAVNGAAAGAGMALALAADIRIAADDAKFNAAFVRIGLTGGDVGTSWALPRLIGLGRASELLLTGRFVLAAEAREIGLVTDVTASATLMERAVETADLIIRNSPVGIELTKHVLQCNVDAPSLDAALALENRNQVLAAHTADMPAALTAFRAKKDPIFQGR
jgi:enoyl-CoA hydratase/carnithine racemase